MSLYTTQDRPVVEKTCTTPGCPENGVIRELAAFAELGRMFLHDDNDVICRKCGEEMTDA